MGSYGLDSLFPARTALRAALRLVVVWAPVAFRWEIYSCRLDSHGFPRHWLRGPPLFRRWFGQLCFLGGLFELLRGFAGRARTQVSSVALPLQRWRLQPGATPRLLASPLIEGASAITQRRDFAITAACECLAVLFVVLPTYCSKSVRSAGALCARRSSCQLVALRVALDQCCGDSNGGGSCDLRCPPAMRGDFGEGFTDSLGNLVKRPDFACAISRAFGGREENCLPLGAP